MEAVEAKALKRAKATLSKQAVLARRRAEDLLQCIDGLASRVQAVAAAPSDGSKAADEPPAERPATVVALEKAKAAYLDQYPAWVAAQQQTAVQELKELEKTKAQLEQKRKKAHEVRGRCRRCHVRLNRPVCRTFHNRAELCCVVLRRVALLCCVGSRLKRKS